MPMKDCAVCAVKLMFVLCVSCFIYVAAAQSEINHFAVGSNICTPVKVKTSRGDLFYLYGEERTIVGRITWVEAWDCEGRKIMDLTPDRKSFSSGKPSEYWYVFNTLYPQEDNRKTDNSNSSTSSSSYRSSDASFGSSVGTAISTWITRGSGGSYSKGYPNFQFNVGLSRAYGEFARLRWYTGGDQGFLLYGGIGKDWLLNGDNKDITSWHIGLGGYGELRGDYEDIAIGISMCETPIVKGGALMLDVLYSYYFDKGTRFGVFAGGGIGVGNLRSVKTVKRNGREHTDWSHAKFLWDVSVGVSLKLWVD